jgi:hypothetical protein
MISPFTSCGGTNQITEATRDGKAMLSVRRPPKSLSSLSAFLKVALEFPLRHLDASSIVSL